MSLSENFDQQQRTRQRLIAAASANDAATLETLLKGGHDPNTTDADGQTLGHIAAKAGHAEALGAIIAGGADVNRTINNDKRGDLHEHSILRFALKAESMACVKALMAAGVDPYHRSYCSDEGRPTSDAMINIKDFEMARALRRYADPYFINQLVNMPDWDDAKTVRSSLEFMASRGTKEIKADTIDRFGRTALMHACAFGHQESVAVLLEFGADVNMRGRDGMTPLHFAAQGKNANIIKMLVDAKARLTAKTEDGLEPLDAARSKGSAEVVAAVSEAVNAFISSATEIGAGVTPLKTLKFKPRNPGLVFAG